jgi:hypothetical protein
MLCLIAFANNLKDFTFWRAFWCEEDSKAEWIPAIELYEKEIGTIKPNMFDYY